MASFYNYRCDEFKYTYLEDLRLYQIDSKFEISLDDREYRYILTIFPGFRTDGGSIPYIFKWFIPGWKDNDCRFNGCYILHDALYCSQYVHRSIADDMLRSSLRDCGIDRLHASTVCWCVNNFAASHYRIDDNKDFVKFDVVSLTCL